MPSRDKIVEPTAGERPGDQDIADRLPEVEDYAVEMAPSEAATRFRLGNP